MYLVTLLLTLLLLPLPATAILRLKIQNWFPTDRDYWIEAASKCEPQIHAYLIDNRTADCPTPCSCAADCVLDGIPGTLESNYASAQVVLGLIPAVLLLIGPSVAEIAVLSTRRPLLAVMVAMGCPTSYLGRVFQRVDTRKVLKDTNRSLIGTKLADYLADPSWNPSSGSNPGTNTQIGSGTVPMRRRHGVTRRVTDGGMYLVALAAIANGIEISIYTDLRTISGWRCGALFMPMVWFLMGIVEHGWTMIAVRAQIWSQRRQASTENMTGAVSTATSPPHPTTGLPQMGSSSRARSVMPSITSIIRWVQARLRALIISDLYTSLPFAEPTVLSELLFWVAQATALVHMVFGIFELSSLVFISALESVQVSVRYAVSVVLGQIVVQIEVATIRTELQRQKAQAPISKSRGLSLGVLLRDEQGASGESISLGNIRGAAGSVRSQGSSGIGGNDDVRNVQ